MSDVAVLTLGRRRALGEGRRVAAWESIIRAAGHRPHVVELVTGHRATVPVPSVGLLRGREMPEAALWSTSSATRAIEALDASGVVAVTGRAFAPTIARRWSTILDLVDRLSVSYLDRARATGVPLNLLYHGLARTAHRFEQGPLRATVAAGWADAEMLGAAWIPNIVVPIDRPVGVTEDHDVSFVGTLDYPPNVEAVALLDRLWPAVQARRPGTSLLLAGARPTRPVVEAASRRGWTLVPDFPDLASVLHRARVAVAPLPHASGIQNKVLDAAAAGRAQIVSPTVAGGLDPDFPVRVADDDTFVGDLVGLLDDERAATDEARRAQAHVLARYSADAWAPWLVEALSLGAG